MAQGTEVDRLFVALGVDLSGLERGLKDASRALKRGLDFSRERRQMERGFDSLERATDGLSREMIQGVDAVTDLDGALEGLGREARDLGGLSALDGLGVPFRRAEDEAEELQDRIQGIERSSGKAAREVGSIRDALRGIDRVGLIGAATGIDDDQVELIGTLGSILPKIATAGGPAAAAIAGIGTAAVGVPAVLAGVSGGLTAVATALARDYGTRDLQQALSGVSAEVRTLKEDFVAAFEPAIRGAVIPAMRALTQAASGLVDEMADITFAVGRAIGSLEQLAGLPGIGGALGTLTAGITAQEGQEPIDLLVDRVNSALDQVDDQIQLARRKFEVGLIPREEMVAQIAAFREQAVEQLLKVQTSFGQLFPPNLISDQVQKLQAVRQQLQALTQAATTGRQAPQVQPTQAPTAGPQSLQTPSLDQLAQQVQVVTIATREAVNRVREVAVGFGQQAARSIGSAVGQVVSFQAEITSLGDVFTSVGGAIVRSLQRVVSQLASAVTQAAILKGLMSAFGFGLGNLSGASGFGTILGSILPFAKGGIVTGPTLGLIGEAGPEAVIPLDKLRQMQQPAAAGGTLRAEIRMDRLAFELDRYLRNSGGGTLFS